MSDLGSIRTLQSAELEIVHPVTGQGLGVWFVLAGPEHRQRKAAVFDMARKLRERIMASGDLELKDVEADAQAETEMLVATTLGWHGPAVEGSADVYAPVTFGGAPLPFSADAARTLYDDPERHWLRQQVRGAVERRALFIGGSPSA